ncbi:hypothetical protein AYO22_01991 [Fonsecaea multimorphosa]|nr:hypothetical protein AYO22_01991 [Fonsecaea multimorphosa]
MLNFERDAVQPDDNIFQISFDDASQTTNQGLIHAIGIGRLFVNVSDAEDQRISKWTGYEVFVDWDLALWMVFDPHSLNPRAKGWYPEYCTLAHPSLKISSKKVQLPSDESKTHLFDIYS